MTTPEIFQKHNHQLKSKLIPEKTEPIYCNSVINPMNELR